MVFVGVRNNAMETRTVHDETLVSVQPGPKIIIADFDRKRYLGATTRVHGVVRGGDSLTFY